MPNAQDRAIRAVAYFEALKGAVVLLAATGLLSLVHRDLYSVAAVFIEHTHLNPASRYPQIFLDAAAKLNDSHLLLLAAGAAMYSLVRFVEAYGLFFGRAWAEVLAALSGLIYTPFEVFELMHKASWHSAVMLALNVALVGIMVQALIKCRAQKHTAPPDHLA
jgi:uncharacterized membrane protein (DUF2068 family)